jgi:parallel beta-helix repeat protein
MNRKIIYVLIMIFISLFLLSSLNVLGYKEISSSSYLQYPLHKILYVGGSGPNNYSTIQDAINNAYNGDIVFVYSKELPYFENIIITRGDIRLIGENKYTTIIDGNGIGDVVQIKGDNTTIQGFTLQHSGMVGYPDYDAGVNVIYPSYYNTITDNIVIDNLEGICLEGSLNNSISNNLVSNNEKGLHFSGPCFYNVITSNDIENNDYGLYFGFNVYNTISENNIVNNSVCGLYLYFVRFTEIHRNNFINNTRHVYYIERFRFAFDRNDWMNNYWDNWIGIGPKVLKGQMYTEWVGQKLVPWINFDWFPARNPYTI